MNGKAINSSISVWTGARTPLFSSNINSLLLSNRVTWENREMVWKDSESIFSVMFSWTSPLSDRKLRSLFTSADVCCLFTYQRVTIHSQDRRGVASLSSKNPAKITVLMCEQKAYSLWFCALVRAIPMQSIHIALLSKESFYKVFWLPRVLRLNQNSFASNMSLVFQSIIARILNIFSKAHLWSLSSWWI